MSPCRFHRRIAPRIEPGPVFTTATFIGYLTGSWTGALLATVAIFLPSFVFVAFLGKILPLVQRTPWARAALDGVNAASFGLMAAVSVRLFDSAVVDPFTGAMAGASFLIVWKTGSNLAWRCARRLGARGGVEQLHLMYSQDR